MAAYLLSPMTLTGRSGGRYLMFYAQSTAKGRNYHIRAEQKCNRTTSNNYDSLLNTHVPPLGVGELLGKMKLNEPERQKLGR